MAPALKMIAVVTEADTGLGFAFSAGRPVILTIQYCKILISTLLSACMRF